ncbi:hypothetical protein [Hymenobacter sp. BT491]|uniref:hypothetical protein n=1 Tax=Hymenobacter sp. BT491 TaxID=2766779 RepID=UPI001653CE00|nr:hypothetical protein [Hymenobacter sp. BT491]MBC6988117.1 hypothetical protein [Hymenobacter sp. BT491]
MLTFTRGKSLLVVVLLILLTWASWEDPSLHDYVEPVSILQLQIDGLRTPPQAVHLQQQMAAVPGVAACSINARTQLATLLYHAGTVSEAELLRVVSVGGVFAVAKLEPAPRANDRRQCPVPPGYTTALERIRFALNLRRLFVRI